MKKNIFENEKFIFSFFYNKKTGKFRDVNFKDKDLNLLEKKILKEAVNLFYECSIQELYEHLIIRIENRLRDYSSHPFTEGVLMPENLKEYKFFQTFFRKILKNLISKDIRSRINFQCLKPSEKWTYLNDQKKHQTIMECLKKFKFPNEITEKNIRILRIENKSDIFIDIQNMFDIDMKNKLCLYLEIFLKRSLEESLNIYLETVVDKNKMRRLKL